MDKVIKQWKEFGHHFVIEELKTPAMRGASMRTHRLYDNGRPAYGGQWHYNVENAVNRADYVLQNSYLARITWLENRVTYLERKLRDGKF